MRLIGYWIRSLDDADYVPPQEFVGPMADEIRLAVAHYLGRGELFEQYRGRSWCRFGCDRQMGSREFTDGLWVWPEDLDHYVRDHSVLLPDEFIRHALAGSPPLPKSAWETVESANDAFWKQWCREHRSGKLRAHIELAKRQADEESRRSFEAAVTDLESKEGVSAERCMWAGCANLALAGRAECARCSLKSEKWRFDIVYHRLSSVLGIAREGRVP